MRCAKENIVLRTRSLLQYNKHHYDPTYSDSLVLHPALLACICDPSLTRETNPATNAVWHIVHFAQERHQKTRLPATGWSDNEINCALLEDYFIVNLEAELAATGGNCAVDGLSGRPDKGGRANANIRRMSISAINDNIFGVTLIELIEELSLSW
jgi:hypothetical protein